MKEITANPDLVAYCGLYCGACKPYLIGKCSGCHNNEKATWCKIRGCCSENEYKSCADCKTYPDSVECKKLNNLISKIFAIIFGSNRNASLKRIQEIGYESYAQEMCKNKAQAIKR